MSLLNSMLKHVILFFSFQHDGTGLKTHKSFTVFLMVVFFIASMISLTILSEDAIHIKQAIITSGLIGVIYLMSNKELVNSTFMGLSAITVLETVFPSMRLLFITWFILAIIFIHLKHNKKAR